MFTKHIPHTWQASGLVTTDPPPSPMQSTSGILKFVVTPPTWRKQLGIRINLLTNKSDIWLV